jgi:hypothetical protein
MTGIYSRLIRIPLILCCLYTSTALAQEQNWALTLYQAVLTDDPIEDVLLGQADYDSNFQLTALALSKTIPVDDTRYDLEWELQAIKHTRGQDHEEFNALLAARWYPLPWDGYLNTDVAVGFGLSYATELPEFEVANKDDAEELLAYILVEFEFKPQSWESWSLVVRSHHRSGVFGLFNGVEGASNSLGLGVKYRF